MALTKDAEAGLRKYLDGIPGGLWLEADKCALTIADAIANTRAAIDAAYNLHERGSDKSCADCTVLVALKPIRTALEGEA